MAEIQQLDPREHVLQRPSMYIGSTDRTLRDVWTMDETERRMVKKETLYSSALMKIFDEILVNALDRVAHNDSDLTKYKVKKIQIDIGEWISITNDGDGLSSAMHPSAGVPVPQLAFGQMLTSTNYDDTQDRITGGMNGIGSKACNIFSTKFKIETVDHVRKKLYVQRWEDNMSVCGEPKITACSKVPYTRVSFIPDYERFGMSGLDDDTRSILLKRAYDACAVTGDKVAVFINGVNSGIKKFPVYSELFFGKTDDAGNPKKKAFQTFPDDDKGYTWDLVATSWDRAEQVSFVNGVATLQGGKHVDHVVNQIARKTSDLVNKRNKDANVKPQHVKDKLFVVLRSTIPNPVFNGQTKEYLDMPATKFKRKVDVSDKFVDDLIKNTDIVGLATSLASVTQAKAIKKTDGAKKNTVRVPKLDDANWAGTAKSNSCTLILTEGDSAKTMAIAGLSVIGRDKYGVFPLRGKLLNVRDVTAKRISENEEITNIKKIMGLENNRKYDSTSELRYGKIMVLTDQDVDGSHIKGLLLNVFSSMWPSLFSMDGFLSTMATPIVKVMKGKTVHSFYNLSMYDEWRAEHGQEPGWSIKYYKGLGTSTTLEAKEYFKQMKSTDFVTLETSGGAMELAFNKKHADDRKAWLKGYDRSKVLRGDQPELSHRDFVDYELIHFSNYDLERSLPSAIDGMKISHRKIMYGCFKRRLTSEIRVAQLAGYVSEHAAYHHGETSLQGAIVSLAQDFVGSNNVNLLQPNGQFGTRIQGGKDCASARYIHTELSPITVKIFRPEDNPVLEYRQDDGATIEPLYYVPIIPMVLINGAEGIGTGFSTCIPCFDPLEVLDNTRRYALEEELEPMAPKYRGFKGEIVGIPEEDGSVKKWKSKGIVKRHSDKAIEITELPVGTWTEDYKTFLEAEATKGGTIKAIESHYTEMDVRFVVKYATSTDAAAACENLEKLKLSTSPKNLWMTNVHLFCANSVVTKFAGIEEIVREHGKVRLKTYELRKAHQIAELEALLVRLNAKARFVSEVISGDIKLLGTKRAHVETQLEDRGYPDLGGKDYLIQMPVASLTLEKHESLLADAAAKAEDLAALMSTTPVAMWLRELDELRTELLKDDPKK